MKGKREEQTKLFPSPSFLLLIDELKVFAGLEADGLAGGDAHLGTGARVAADAGLSRLYGEHAKAAQLDAVTVGERGLHGLEDGIDGRLSLDAWKPCAFNDPLNEILLDQWRTPSLAWSL
jgi:hypothetical protein